MKKEVVYAVKYNTNLNELYIIDDNHCHNSSYLICEDKISGEHDTGYKFLLSTKKVFVELLKSFIKGGWVEQIDETELSLINKSFILNDFHKKEADLVYKLKIKDKNIIFYILMELQSKVDFKMPYRLLQYQLEIWRDYIRGFSEKETERKDFRLPTIVPIVLYNGANNWTASKSFCEYLEGHELFGSCALDFKYIVIDINRYKEQELVELTNLIGSVFLIDQDHKSNEDIIKKLIQLTDTLKSLPSEQYSMFQNWLFGVIVDKLPDYYRSKIGDIIKNSKGVDDMVYSIQRTLKRERREGLKEGLSKGREEGRSEGRLEEKLDTAKKMLEEGMEIALVKKITGLTDEQIGSFLL